MSCNAAALTEVLAYLEDHQISTWLFGGWAEELRSLHAPRLHHDIDLLYPNDDFEEIDNLIRSDGLDEITAKTSAHKRAVVLHEVMVEIFLVGHDAVGWHTLFWGRARHDWPADLLGDVEGHRIASVAALQGYRCAHAQLHNATAWAQDTG